MKSYSEIKQDLAGTTVRNKIIKFRCQHGKRGIQSQMAREYHISRQAIHRIVHNPNVILTHPQKHRDGFLGGLWKKLMDWVGIEAVW